jgi:hypothetical protein
MPRRGRPLTPRQSVWCFLGLHRWISLGRYQRYEGVLYEITYCRCDRAGCTRYPTWIRVDVSRVRH